LRGLSIQSKIPGGVHPAPPLGWRVLSRAGLLILLVSCGPRALPNPFIGSAQSISDTSQAIRSNAQRSLILTEEGGRQAPELPQWEGIAGHQRTILDQADKLDAQGAALRGAEKENARLKSDLSRANSSAKKWQAWAFGFMVVAGAFCLIGSIVLIKFDPKLAGFVALASVASIAVGLTMQALAGFFDAWGWAIGAGVAGLIIFILSLFGWTLYRKVKRDNREATEMAEMAQDVKNPNTPTDIDHFIAHWAEKLPLLAKAKEKLEGEA
jgi:hypothetical protein